MICSQFDWKAYLLGETPESQRRQADEHAAACAACGEELERLRLTQMALLAVREEEMPRRIAFVSDKVFEPRWWQRLWNSGPVLGFASAAMLAIAIVTHGLVAPAPVPAPAPAAAVDVAAIEARIEEEVARRLPSAIATAVAEVEARKSAETTKLVADMEKRFEFQRKADLLAMEDTVNLLRKHMARMYVANHRYEAAP